MEELITRIVANVGIDDSKARDAVRIILSFLYEEGNREKVVELVKRMPGAEAYIEAGDADAAEMLGGFGGLMGGGAMAVLGKLQGLGLGMVEIQSVTRETVSFARERAGSDVVDEIVASIPGLGQFV